MLKRYRLLLELKKTLAMLVGILSLGVASAYAEPIDNGNYTSSNGLDWLDLTETRGISYDRIIAATQDPNNSLYGWRLATGEEFDALMQDFGFTSSTACSSGLTFCDYYEEDTSPVNTAISMLGDTYVDALNGSTESSITNGNGYAWGLLADEYSEGYHHSAMILDSLNGNEAQDQVQSHWGHINPDYINNGNAGAFLVKGTLQQPSDLLSLEDFVTELSEIDTAFTVALLDLNKFRHFKNHYGDVQADELMSVFTDLIRKHINADSDFAAHIRGDNFAVVIQQENWQSVLSALFVEFDQQAVSFYSAADQEQGGITITNRFGRERLIDFVSVSGGAITTNNDNLIPFKLMLKGLKGLNYSTKLNKALRMVHKQGSDISLLTLNEEGQFETLSLK